MLCVSYGKFTRLCVDPVSWAWLAVVCVCVCVCVWSVFVLFEAAGRYRYPKPWYEHYTIGWHPNALHANLLLQSIRHRYVGIRGKQAYPANYALAACILCKNTWKYCTNMGYCRRFLMPEWFPLKTHSSNYSGGGGGGGKTMAPVDITLRFSRPVVTGCGKVRHVWGLKLFTRKPNSITKYM